MDGGWEVVLVILATVGRVQRRLCSSLTQASPLHAVSDGGPQKDIIHTMFFIETNSTVC